MTLPQDQRTDVTLAILAGGEGSRLGVPKGLLRVNEQPILEYLLDRLAWRGPTLLVTAPGRENPPGTARFDRQAVDSVSGQGPLRGILTALENTITPLVVVTAVDMPMVEPMHLEQLIEEFRARSALLGLMTRRAKLQDEYSHVRTNMRTSGGKLIEPFPSIFHIDAAAVLIQRLEARKTSVSSLTSDPLFAAMDLGWDRLAWLNINSPLDVEQMKQLGLRITGYEVQAPGPRRRANRR